jgi:hypothetical protein
VYLALIVANGNPNGTLAQIAAFVPPLRANAPPWSPMVVPARMVLGDMNTLGLALGVALDLLATAGLVVLSARRLGKPLAIALVVAGLLLIFALERRKRPAARRASVMKSLAVGSVATSSPYCLGAVRASASSVIGN